MTRRNGTISPRVVLVDRPVQSDQPYWQYTVGVIGRKPRLADSAHFLFGGRLRGIRTAPSPPPRRLFRTRRRSGNLNQGAALHRVPAARTPLLDPHPVQKVVGVALAQRHQFRAHLACLGVEIIVVEDADGHHASR